MNKEYAIICLCTLDETPMKCIDHQPNVNEYDLMIFECDDCGEQIEIRFRITLKVEDKAGSI